MRNNDPLIPIICLVGSSLSFFAGRLVQHSIEPKPAPCPVVATVLERPVK